MKKLLLLSISILSLPAFAASVGHSAAGTVAGADCITRCINIFVSDVSSCSKLAGTDKDSCELGIKTALDACMNGCYNLKLEGA